MFDPLILLAATEAAASGTEAKEGLVGTFDLDWKLILAQGINFIIVATLLWKFAFKPVIATMDERGKKISDGLQYAEEAKQQLSSAEKEKAEKLREANTEAQAIIHGAKSRADALAAEQKEQVDREIAEKRRRADESIEQERQKVLAEAKQDIARLVVLTSGKVLGRELTPEDKSRFNSSAAQEVANLNN